MTAALQLLLSPFLVAGICLALVLLFAGEQPGRWR